MFNTAIMEVLVQGVSECGVSPSKAPKLLVLCANKVFGQNLCEY